MDNIDQAWERYQKDHDGKAFLRAISTTLFMGFKLPYLKAIVLHDMGEEELAARNIKYAIDEFERRECGECNSRCGEPIYNMATKIFHNIGEKDLYLKYCAKLARYNPLKSDFDNRNNLAVYSFRNYTQYTIQDLINNEITVVRPSEMNDPFDSVFNFFRDINNLKLLCPSERDVKPIHERFNYVRIRSFCLGGRPHPTKNILMWSHYTDGHKGFCIKYRLSKNFINNTTDNGYLCMKKIRYTKDSIHANMPTIEDDVAFATKNYHWEYEREVRLINYDISTESPFLAQPIDKDSSIEEIFFGYRCASREKEAIYNIVKSRYPKCTFKQMEIDHTQNIYALKAVPYKGSIP